MLRTVYSNLQTECDLDMIIRLVIPTVTHVSYDALSKRRLAQVWSFLLQIFRTARPESVQAVGGISFNVYAPADAQETA